MELILGICIFIIILCYICKKYNNQIIEGLNDMKDTLCSTGLNECDCSENENSGILPTTEELQTKFPFIVKIKSSKIKFDWKEPYQNGDTVEGTGTGFFFTKDLLLTCSHVVIDSTAIMIKIPNFDDLYPATIVGICPDLDIALLTTNFNFTDKYLTSIGIEDSTKPFFEFGDSDCVNIGDVVYTIGYPLDNTITSTNSTINGRSEGLLKTDTTINPGNSGGPLFKNKKIIGIISSKVISSGIEGTGYVIPIKQYLNIKEFMIQCYDKCKNEKYFKNKIVFTPRLGAKFQNSQNSIMSVVGNNSIACKKGYFIREIINNCSFSKANILPGDILCCFNGYKLNNDGETEVCWSEEKIPLIDLMKRHTINQEISVIIWKGENHHEKEQNKVVKKNIKLTNPFIESGLRVYYPKFENIDYEVFAGIVIMKLTHNHVSLFDFETLSKYRKIENYHKNLLIITHIFPSTKISNLNILGVGDIITEVNGIQVSDIDNYRMALRKPLNGTYISYRTIDNYYCVLKLNDIKNEYKSIYPFNESIIYEHYNSLLSE